NRAPRFTSTTARARARVDAMHRPPGTQGMAGKPFRATYIWSSIITNLHAGPTMTASWAPRPWTRLLAHIIQSKFCGDAEVPRAKAARLCQALMDSRVFEAVGTNVFGKEKKRATFEDSSCSLYRFLDAQKRGTANPDGPGQRIPHLHQRRERRQSLTDECTVVDEVWRQQTVLRLLQLIELPLLESLLDGKESPRPPLHGMDSDPDLLYTSSYVDREILKAFGEAQADNWLSAAVDCLEFLPDQLVVDVSRGLPKCSDESDQCKRLIYGVLAQHYGEPQHPPLLSNHVFDIHSGISELLVNGKREQALEALQLCLKLQDSRSREELRRLLRFMATAADPQEVRVHKEVSGNRMAVKRAFSSAIVYSARLAKGKVDLMVLFLMDNHSDAFKIPGSLHRLVSEKLASIIKGKDPNSVTGTTFCQRISGQAYTETVQETTKEELWALLKTIHENAKLSVKEKKRLLGQFYKGHPEIFVQYFGTRIASVDV
uniref:DEP domain-containing protein n=1 Tax=Denticeps clupeoides TaxID=299321 RepID=A0AAY4E0Z2_9TELE